MSSGCQVQWYAKQTIKGTNPYRYIGHAIERSSHVPNPKYTDYVIPQSADLVTFLGALLHPNTANERLCF